MTYKPAFNPWEPPALTDVELLALKSLAAGNASDHQQKLALATIVRKFAAYSDMSFRPGGPEGARATDFAEGKRFVGSRIIEAIDRPMKTSTGESNVGSEPTAAAAAGTAAANPTERARKNPKPRSERTRPGSSQ